MASSSAVKRLTLGPQWQHQLSEALTRSFSAAAAAAQAASSSSSAAAASADAVKKFPQRKNLFEVAQFLANWGIGAKFHKAHWASGCYYKITKVKINKDGRHGKAWGIFHQDEAPTTGEAQRIGGVHKRCWRYIKEEPAFVWRSISTEEGEGKSKGKRKAKDATEAEGIEASTESVAADDATESAADSQEKAGV